jgi:hypothetical protein
VTRDKHSLPVEWREIAARADLRVILQSALAERTAAGWICTDIGRACGFFFAERAGERVQVSVELYDPAGPGHQSHSAPG